MSIVKSFSCGNGDMFYIRHNSDNFTIIDCNLFGDDDHILDEVSQQARDKGIVRFISTHPDQDHLSGLVELDNKLKLRNFYCVKNSATKSEPTADFERYCQLRDSDKAFYVKRGCSRRWMNKSNEERGSAGINVLWPDANNPEYKAVLEEANAGGSPNNLSCIVKYSLEGGVTMLWMGDLESDFMEAVEDEIELPEVDILFPPHHGRASGKVPPKWLEEMDPRLVVIGEAPAKHLDYYDGYDTITQNSCGAITFQCLTGKTHIYVESATYTVGWLDNEYKDDAYGHYIGTLST
ncbi:MAG: ComEC/Rec2 family competence protein [Actinomycetota bacterium]